MQIYKILPKYQRYTKITKIYAQQVNEKVLLNLTSETLLEVILLGAVNQIKMESTRSYHITCTLRIIRVLTKNKNIITIEKKFVNFFYICYARSIELTKPT